MRKPVLLTIFFLVSALSAQGADSKYKIGDLPTDDQTSQERKASKNNAELETPDTAKLANDIAEEFYEKGMRALNEGNLELAEGYFDRVLILIPRHQGAKEGIDKIMKAYEQPQNSPSDSARSKVIGDLEGRMNSRYQAGDLEGADEISEKILAIDPQNKSAHQKQNLIRKELFDRAVARADQRESAGDVTGSIDALKVALSYRNELAVRQRMRELQEKLSQANVAQSDKLYIEALAASQDGDTDKAVTLCRQALRLNPANEQAKRMLARLVPKATPIVH